MRGAVLMVTVDRRLAVLADGLLRKGFEVVRVDTAAQALTALVEQHPDVVMVDLHLPAEDGPDVVHRLVESRPEVPIIAVAEAGTLETAVASMRAGAYDYLFPPLRLEAVAIALDRAVQHRSLRREVRRLRKVVAESRGLDHLIGASTPMRELFDLVERVAHSDASVLVTGETGTGKEVVARAIHRHSRRAEGPFVAINCAAVPESLLESELFGHVRGAFTDARTARSGLFVQAAGGTIFLDEIGDMPLSLQPKLLRSLQDRVVRPVGSDHEVPFDARVIAATNRDLEADVDQGGFRRDLYFRVNVIQVDVPPLRRRSGDVLLLARHFVGQSAMRAGKRVTGLSPDASAALLEYPWPGNVRELENCIERAVALTQGGELTLQDLPVKVQERTAPTPGVTEANVDDLLPMRLLEERHIRRVLSATRGNKALAARILGYDRKRLYRKLATYGIEVPEAP